MWTSDDIIDAYTRENAISDGDLVDVTDVAREAGFRWPVAVTRAVWIDCVAWTDEDSDRTGCPQDQVGRLWDVVYVASRIARQGGGGSRTFFQLVRVPAKGNADADMVVLELVAGPGDDGEPVITLQFPGED